MALSLIHLPYIHTLRAKALC